MKKLFNPLFITSLSIVLLTACTLPKSNKTLPNPASVFCAEHGGTSKIVTAQDGGQSGMCIFADGSQCEEWAFFNGDCKAGASASLAKDFPSFDPAKVSCPNFQPPQEGIVNTDGKEAIWQTMALENNKNTIATKGTIQLGIRNKMGTPKDTFDYEVTVKTPDSTFSSTSGKVIGDQFAQNTYPTDFSVGSTNTPGVYSLVYTINDQLVGCDGFIVQ